MNLSQSCSKWKKITFDLRKEYHSFCFILLNSNSLFLFWVTPKTLQISFSSFMFSWTHVLWNRGLFGNFYLQLRSKSSIHEYFSFPTIQCIGISSLLEKPLKFPTSFLSNGIRALLSVILMCSYIGSGLNPKRWFFIFILKCLRQLFLSVWQQLYPCNPKPSLTFYSICQTHNDHPLLLSNFIHMNF